MERETYRRAAYQMIRLVCCALNGKKPDSTWVQKLDLPVLFQICQEHILTACAAYALESAGVQDAAFTDAKMKAIRKNILLDAERKTILARLEEAHIWYMPLKGALLKDWYPKLGMRQMSDNDILYDGTFRNEVCEIMRSLGFTCSHFGKGADDAYLKEPVYNFEMHHQLFVERSMGVLLGYYENVQQRLIRDTDSAYGYHFSLEDFYLYMIAHEYKHYITGGTGVRSLADTFVFIRKFGETLDWDYLRKELETMQITEYEQQNRELAIKLFSGERLSPAEKKRLDYYIFSGTYGNMQNRVENSIQRFGEGSKAKYIFQRVFPPMEQIKAFWPFFYRHKWLIPLLWIYRPFRGLTIKRTKLKSELRVLRRK